MVQLRSGEAGLTGTLAVAQLFLFLSRIRFIHSRCSLFTPKPSTPPADSSRWASKYLYIHLAAGLVAPCNDSREVGGGGGGGPHPLPSLGGSQISLLSNVKKKSMCHVCGRPHSSRSREGETPHSPLLVTRLMLWCH